MHTNSEFITLTYDDKNLPANLSLRYRDYQLFMKRLRKKYNCYDVTQGVWTPRFYMGGEYGEQTSRPHYHAAIFGLHLNDKIYHKKTEAGFKVYKSEILDKLWGKGFTWTGEVTFESAAYIARYIMKKMTGDGNKKEYEIIDLETGEIQKRTKEFNQMSRKPGIGATWLQKYKGDAYPQGKIVVNGHEQQPPRYYDKKWAEEEPEAWEELQHKRFREGLKYLEERTPERLAVQEQVQEAKTKSLTRNLE